MHSQVKDSGHQTEAFDLWEAVWASPTAPQYDHKACRSRGEHRWGLWQSPGPFYTLLLTQTRARRERERAIHQAKALCCLGGAGTDPITLIGPQWGAWTPCLHGHQCPARSTGAGSELDRAGAVTCFSLYSLEDQEWNVDILA